MTPLTRLLALLSKSAKQRLLIKSVAHLDDHLLKDIGLARRGGTVKRHPSLLFPYDGRQHDDCSDHR